MRKNERKNSKKTEWEGKQTGEEKTWEEFGKEFSFCVGGSLLMLFSPEKSSFQMGKRERGKKQQSQKKGRRGKN